MDIFKKSKVFNIFRITTKVVAIFQNNFPVTVTPDFDPESVLFDIRF